VSIDATTRLATAIEPPVTLRRRLAAARRLLRDPRGRRGAISWLLLILLWQLGASSSTWLGEPLPWIGRLPAPNDVLAAGFHLAVDPGYWRSWLASGARVLLGFAAAVLCAVPFSLLLAGSAAFRGVAYPVFELLRPVPPLAWVPAAIIFWPTQELSIAFVIFLGAFYPIVLNVVGGARSIDVRLLETARSLGASRWSMFRRLLLPAVLPWMAVGMEVGIGITWEVVVAAEMISGGGAGEDAASGGGLGFLIWSSYVGGSYPQIIVGMISIGVAGYGSSTLLRAVGARLTPWRREPAP
jgi:NitT/TauT family transport system permease protein